MDPNETLRRLRQLSALALCDEPDIDVTKEELAELFCALDGWIMGGGFLPQAWQR